MAHTNSTENYGLPQWIGTDKPTFLGDFNTAFGVIDGALKDNADASTAAVATANSASAVASSANTNATTALSTANEAKADAASAVTTASTANSKATQAQTDAASALHASAGNSIENLAPAYDPTLTYNVGDLVTYIDAQNSGKMYKCIVAVNTPMEFNINYWDDVTTSEVYAQISSGTSIEDVINMITSYIESTEVASRNYSVGDYFVLNSVLYRVTQTIVSGNTIVPNTNCTATNVTAEIEAIESLSGDITDIKSDIAGLAESVETSTTSAHAYNIGDHFMLNHVEYMATKPISIGATISSSNSTSDLHTPFIVHEVTTGTYATALAALRSYLPNVTQFDLHNYKYVIEYGDHVTARYAGFKLNSHWMYNYLTDSNHAESGKIYIGTDTAGLLTENGDISTNNISGTVRLIYIP